MPTPGERRALLFVASVAALGVAARGWREFHPADSPALAGNRAALARQIEAVDSAIAVSSSARKPREPRAAAAPGTPRAPRPAAPAGEARPAQSSRPARTSGRAPETPDPPVRDPRQAYWDRSLYFDSLRLASVRESDAQRERARDAQDARGSPHAGRSSRGSRASPPVDLDVAGIEEVAALPLIGSALARRIVTNRVDNGPFGSILGLQRVSGITPAFARRIEPFVTFSGSSRLGSAGESPPRSKSDSLPRRKSRP